MPWIDGEPPKDGKAYVCETPSHDGPLFLRWFKYNGTEAWRDWDADAHLTITRWYPLDDWQPIETADRHSEDLVLLWDAEDNRVCLGKYHFGGPGWVSEGFSIDATHWMAAHPPSR